MSLRKRLLVKPPSSGVTPSKNFKAVIYTGNGGTQAITGVGFKPDFVWIKCRSTSHSHFAADSTRGANKYLMPNETSAELTRSDQIQSFDTDGFTLAGNGDVNGSGKTYVAWCLKAGEGTTSSNTDGSITSTVQANQDAGFSIVTWTGDGNVSTLGHGLSKVPEMVIAKGRANLATYNRWTTYHHSLSENHLVYLDLSDAEGNAGADKYFDDSAFSNTVFGVGDDAYGPNVNGTTMVAYCFHSVDNFSKFDLYTGNGSANGPIVETGFEPAFLIVKGKSNSGSWLIFDNKRNTTNPRTKILYADSGTTETTNSNIKVDFLSNGFQLTGTDTDYNGSGRTYIYMAFAADPDTEAPTVARSFSTNVFTDNTSNDSLSVDVGFKPGFIWTKYRGGSQQHYMYDNIRSKFDYLSSNDTYGNQTRTFGIEPNENGFTKFGNVWNRSGTNQIVAWTWKADDNEPTINTEGNINSVVSANANAGFSIVKWNGTGSAGTVGHSLSSAPEMVITKRLSGTSDWYTYHKDLNSGSNPAYNFIKLNSSDAEIVNASSGGSIWNSTSPSSTVINIGTSLSGNGDEYIAYCFHSVSGYSKISSYQGNGSTQSITGLGFQPDWIIIKEVDGTDSWEVYDSVRGDDKVLYPNGSNAEGTTSNFTSFDSNGFTLSSATSVNQSGKNYIYMAFKIN